jgi:hypothetical protein
MGQSRNVRQPAETDEKPGVNEMTVIYCDDVLCKIEIVPNMVMPGTFWVVLDGDDETAQIATSHNEAIETAEELYDEVSAASGLSGVGS